MRRTTHACDHRQDRLLAVWQPDFLDMQNVQQYTDGPCADEVEEADETKQESHVEPRLIADARLEVDEVHRGNNGAEQGEGVTQQWDAMCVRVRVRCVGC